MSKTKITRSKASLVYTAVLILLLWVPFVFSVRSINEKYLENEQSYKEQHFSDLATLGKQRVLDCLGQMAEVVNSAGLTLSIVGTDGDKLQELFESM